MVNYKKSSFEKDLLPRERIFYKFPEQGLIVTNYRLRQFSSNSERGKISSVMLDAVGLIELKYRKYLELLGLGVGLMIVAAYLFSDQMVDFSLIILALSVVFVILFFFLGKTEMVIYCRGGGQINISADRLKKEKYIEIVNCIEKMLVERNGNSESQTFSKSDFY